MRGIDRAAIVSSLREIAQAIGLFAKLSRSSLAAAMLCD
jgi:hypothetical protein